MPLAAPAGRETPEMAENERRPIRRRGIIIVLAIVVIGVGWRVWHKSIRPELFPKNFGVVEEGAIYRSGQLTERMLRSVCEEHGIRTIIALNGDDEESEMEDRVAADLGIRRVGFSGLSGDGTGDPDAFAEAVRLMADPARQPVLIHCAAGAQRTGTCVLIYRHVYEGRPISEVYPETFEYGHEADEWLILAWLADHLPRIEERLGPVAASAGGGNAPPGD